MRITVGKGSCGVAAGAGEVFDIISACFPTEVTGCAGDCYLEPIVTVGGKTYVKVDKNGAEEIVKLLKGEDNNAAGYEYENTEKSGLKIALRNCGVINPENIDEYIAAGGYKALTVTPEEVIEEIKTSGLRGRGGAGFPAWFKWRAARDAVNSPKYVICNADEGDPGAFMDRAIIEGDPHSVIEGMIIAAYAIGANHGIVYVRAEYPLAVKRLETALKQAREKGFLGKNFDITVRKGAGAFVCGEETALIASLEGERGMPRLKPPFPAEKGLWQSPTNINNVETYANVPWIMSNGGAAFAAVGTENSKGTKVFALTGKIANGGLAEVPMGTTLKDVIYGYGGGIRDNKNLKAVQIGGPSGGCIPAELIDTQIDYQSLAETGAIMGSGGMVVMDESACMVDMARFFLDFTCKESCGKCVQCRIGNKRMLEILERICNGKGKDGDIELLSELGEGIRSGALCGLGQNAPNPVLTAVKYFRDEYEQHIKHKKCPAGSCRALLNYIIADNCKKCGLCAKKCPSNAITRSAGKYVIDGEKCVKCGECARVCKFGAIEVN